ncbi:MAG: YggS family pyridoxal phosphate-dependent enzyme [SAR324 cluster bacterium]|nr:YggS family pyridoxal phosphate-dependent enzyme [SAR324 cluster bacterium]
MPDSSVADALAAIQARIAEATRQSGRPTEAVRLIAISKTKPPELLREAIAAGQVVFGENRMQEALDKMEALSDAPNLEWHLVGHLQKNKAKFCPGRFHWLHSVDSADLVTRLEARCAEAEWPLQVLLQANLSQEDSKSGLHDWSGIQRLAEQLLGCRWLKFRGLMAIPAPNLGEVETRRLFAQLRNWRDQLRQEFEAPDCTELSMGMTADFEWAIREGSTMVRVGSAIFGARPAPASGAYSNFE